MRVGISTSVIQRGQTGIAQHVFALLRAMLPYTAQHDFVLFVMEEDLPLFDFIRDKMKLVAVPEQYRPQPGIFCGIKHGYRRSRASITSMCTMCRVIGGFCGPGRAHSSLPFMTWRQLFNLATIEGIRNGLRAAGLAQAQKFNLKTTAEQTLRVYQSAANSSRSP